MLRALRILVYAFKNEVVRVIHLIIGRFSEEVSRRKEERLRPVISPGAFIYEMYKRYLEGCRVEIISSVDEGLSSREEAMMKPHLLSIQVSVP